MSKQLVEAQALAQELSVGSISITCELIESGVEIYGEIQSADGSKRYSELFIRAMNLDSEPLTIVSDGVRKVHETLRRSVAIEKV